MTKDEIKKEWDAFIEYPEGSGKLYVTTTSALLFARCIADMAADKERALWNGAEQMAANIANDIRARGNA